MRRPCCTRSFVLYSATAYAASSQVMPYVEEICGMAQRHLHDSARAVAACVIVSIMEVEAREPREMDLHAVTESR